jgi:hypothetical protein
VDQVGEKGNAAGDDIPTWIAAVAPSTPSEIPTARRPARERLMLVSMRP